MRCCSVAKLCSILLQPYRLKTARLLCLWHFLSKNTGVGCRFLLHGIFTAQELKPRPCIAGRFFITEPPRTSEVF